MTLTKAIRQPYKHEITTRGKTEKLSLPEVYRIACKKED